MSAPSSLAGFLDSLPACCEVLRDYQRKQLAVTARALQLGYRRLVMQAPTGSGKTHLMAALTAAATGAQLRVLILATRTRLVRQIHERLEQFGVAHGVIAAPLPGLRNNELTVQVASADTLHRRAVSDKRMPLPPADVVVFDEAHLAGADSRRQLLDSYPDAVRIGFTATPARKSGRGLGAVFQAIVPGPSVMELIAAGMLVKPRIFNTPLVAQAELDGIPKDTSQDYQPKALGALLSRPKLVGDVVQNWLRIASGKRSIVFACSKAHGAQLTQEFTQAGVAAELLTDSDGETTREAVYARLESGQTKVLVNVFLAAYGIDLPAVECIVLARPTRSLVMFLQMTGRGMRPAPGKTDFLLIDHGRVIESLGLPHAPREWTLDEGRNVNRETRDRVRKHLEEQPRNCPDCKHMWLVSEEGPSCRNCGWAAAPRPRAVRVEDAELAELDQSESRTTSQSPAVVQFYREALGDYARQKPQVWQERPNTARAASWHATREKFRLTEYRVPSAYWAQPPEQPSEATAGWLKYRRIRFAKARQRAAA
jgi:superfamily II DNA or RNA helicase